MREAHVDGLSHPSGHTRTRSPAPPSNPGPTADDYLEAFLTFLPPLVIQRIARGTGFVRRHRKLDPFAFETGPHLKGTVEALRDDDNLRVSDPILSIGGYYERVTP